MDDTDLKGYGFWLLAIVESLMVFFAFWLGQLVNGLPIEIFTLIATILGASQVLVFKLIKKYFKIEKEEEI